MLVYHKDIDKLLPQISDRLRVWEKEQPQTRQAGVFDSEQLVEIMRLPRTAHNLPRQAYAVVSIAAAGRGCEIKNMRKCQVTKIT